MKNMRLFEVPTLARCAAAVAIFAGCGSSDNEVADARPPTPDASTKADAMAKAPDATPACTPLAPTASSEYVTTGGAVCNPGDALLLDGKVVGVAYPSNVATVDSIDGVEVVGCLRFDFGSAVQAESLRVVAAGVEQTCGGSCVGNTCGTGDDIEIFTGTNGTSWTHLGDAALTATLANHEMATGRSLRYVLACRAAWGYKRDHLEIDYLEVCTQ